ncbi:hypothetical protein C3L33_00183, partial [Rhododendron williamsianum]
MGHEVYDSQVYGVVGLRSCEIKILVGLKHWRGRRGGSKQTSGVMNRELKRGKVEDSDVKEKVLVAVKASKEIPKTALLAIGFSFAVLMILYWNIFRSRKLWTFPRFAGDCASGNRRSNSGTSPEQKSDITDSFSQMILQLHDVYDPNKINVKIKVVSGSPSGAVARRPRELKLLGKLKHEEKRCMEELQCNIVTMKHSHPKVLRLNLVGSPKKGAEAARLSQSDLNQSFEQQPRTENDAMNSIRGPTVTPSSSPELFTATEVGTSSVSSSDPGASPFFYLISILIKFKVPKMDGGRKLTTIKCQPDLDFNGSMREAVSLSRNAPLGPPPLCSICQHKAPVFGKPPRWFTYAELELATGGFSRANFLAEGGFGSVHRGVLSDGRTVAVKQHKLASSQGDQEFCSEVEEKVAGLEYICNGSLDSHLYGHRGDPLEWSARQKIAVGAARGLRYLHEECRVGCIVHRDMRPNNILITHDFEPLVGDFGLARWQPDGETGVETRVFGSRVCSKWPDHEKADVYSFGVVLVELVTGRKAVDINRPKGQQCLSEWARPLLEEYAIDKLIDPRLANNYNEHEVYCMLHAASMCIRRDPHSRPRMSQVLRILEGDMVMDSSQMSTPRYDAGSQSGRIQREKQQQYQSYSSPLVAEALEGFSGKLSLDSPRLSPFWEREKPARTTSSKDDL